MARRRRCPTTAAPCRAPSWTRASARSRWTSGADRRWTARGPSTSSGTATGSPASCSSTPTTSGHTVACRRLVVADGVALPAGPGARPRVAPRHRLRGGRPRLRALRPQRRRVDLLAPGAARRRRRAARPATAGSSRSADAGEVNIGVGTLATARRPAGVQLRSRCWSTTPTRAARSGGSTGPVRAAGVGAAADGRRGLGRRRAQLGPHRRRRRLRQPAQRRGHRLRPGDRPRRRRAARRATTGRRRGRPPCAGTTARRSPSPAGWPACSPCRGSCRPPDRSGCGRGR